ncbi:MAG: OmpA family protein [Magnetococcus sp. YQC-5]
MKDNKTTTLAILLSVGLLPWLLTACVTPSTSSAAKEGWQGKNGYSQWHPQTGSNTISAIGTQCFFCPEDAAPKPVAVAPVAKEAPKEPVTRAIVAAAPVDSDGDGVFDDQDQCPGTPRGVQVDAVGCIPDSDKDGVTDDKDKCPDTPTGATVNEVGCWIIQNLHFDTNKSEIKSAAFPMLDNVASVLKNNPNMHVEIQGHTDNVGSKALNDKLSKNRANAVMKYITHSGIAANRLTAAGYGASKPVASNKTPADRAKNRRVELKPVR